mgnify:CR=1 FL=1
MFRTHRRVKINKYESIEIFDCDYTSDVGVKYKSKEVKKENNSVENRML